MRRGLIIIMVLALSLMLVSGACAPKKEAATVEDFYRDNTVTIIVNGGQGGGTAMLGRLFASYWTQYTGGAMLVRVMSGGGGIEGLNYVYHAEPDGLTIGDTHHPSDLAAPQLLQVPGPEFDPRELGYLGAIAFDPQFVFLGADSPYNTIDDLKKAGKIVFGASGPGSMTSVGIITFIEIAGLDNAEVVYGYEASEMFLGVKRGEIVGYSLEGGTGGVIVSEGYTKPLVTLRFERSEWFPDTPAITELIDLTPDQEDMIAFVEALVGCKSFYTPPGVEADKLTYLRRTFDKIASDEGFRAQAKARYPIWEKPMTGEALQESVGNVLGMSPAKLEAIRATMAKYIK